MAIAVHIIPVSVDVLPSGQHRSASVHVVPGSADLLPPGQHRSAAVHIVPHILYFLPAGSHDASAVHIVPLAVHMLPSCSSGSASVHIVPFIAQQMPALGQHPAASVGIIPRTLYLVPSGLHLTLGIQIIPASVRTDPSGGQRSAALYPVPGAIDLIPSGFRQHPAVSISIISSALGSEEPCLHHSGLLIHPVPVPADLLPALYHLSAAETIPVSFDLLPAVLGIGSVLMILIKPEILSAQLYPLFRIVRPFSLFTYKEIISCAVHRLKTGQRLSIFIQEIDSLSILCVNGLCAGLSGIPGPVFVQIIPAVIDLIPSGTRVSHTRFGKQPNTFNLLPAVLCSIHTSVFVQVIPGVTGLLPSGHALCGLAVLIQEIPFPVDFLPAGLGPVCFSAFRQPAPGRILRILIPLIFQQFSQAVILPPGIFTIRAKYILARLQRQVLLLRSFDIPFGALRDRNQSQGKIALRIKIVDILAVLGLIQHIFKGLPVQHILPFSRLLVLFPGTRRFLLRVLRIGAILSLRFSVRGSVLFLRRCGLRFGCRIVISFRYIL